MEDSRLTDWNRIKEALSTNSLVIFGTGYYGELWYDRLTRLGFSIKFFADNNRELWNKEIIDGIKCVSPLELLESQGDYLFLLCVKDEYQDEIEKQMLLYNAQYIRMKETITENADYLSAYFGISIEDSITSVENVSFCKDVKDRIAVYTAIFGKYDSLLQPQVVDSGCDYFCISDEKPENLGVFTWIPSDEVIPEQLESATLKNRFCKFFPNKIFHDYKYSIYIDGNVKINDSVEHLADHISDIGLAFFNHPDCNDLYVEAFRFCDQYLDESMPDRIRRQICNYAKEGFPFGFGFVENSIIIREHNNPDCIKIMETWWEEYTKYFTRDQLSFMYSVWKCGFSKKDISTVGTDWRKSSEFSHEFHKSEKPRKHLVFEKNKLG